MKSSFRRNDGITLIELLSTVVIIGVVSAMAVPRFQTAWERTRMRSTDRDMISTLRLARSMAITDKAPFGVFIDGSALTITLFKDVVNPSLSLFESGDSLIRVDTLPAEFGYLGTDLSNDVLVFQPNGSASFTGGGNIYAIACTDKVCAILAQNVLASTGRVRSSSDYY